MNSFFRIGALGLFLLAGLAGCVPDGLTDYDYKQHQPPSTLPEETGNILIGEKQSGDVLVTLHIERGAHTGFNLLRVRLSRSSTQAIIEEASVSFAATYLIDDNIRETPVQNPATHQANADDFFEGGAFFLPAEPELGTFSIAVSFETNDGQSGTVGFPLEVKESLWMQRVPASDGLYFVSWVNPVRPLVGENVFEVALHREEDYHTITDATLDLYPYMDMGGGEGHSTPYEAPAHKKGGQYAGTVNFIMAGGWDMTVYIHRPNRAEESVLFSGYSVYSPL